jgi:hypothetical protein
MAKITYDVVLADTHEYFSSRVMEFCAQFNLSFFLAGTIGVRSTTNWI